MQLVYLPVEQIELDPHGVREDAGDLAGLAETIREQGLLQPLGVVAVGPDRYHVVYGGRRLQAVRQLQFEHVACVLLEDTDDEDRKSTRLNSSHANISYAVFCLKK